MCVRLCNIFSLNCYLFVCVCLSVCLYFIVLFILILLYYFRLFHLYICFHNLFSHNCHCNVLTEQMMGYEAVRIIRSLGYHGVIIGVTGSCVSSDINEFMNAGSNAVLIKPLNLTALRDILQCKLHYIT